MLVDYYQYKEQQFTSKHCGWTGDGSELRHGDFHSESMIGDLECPKCWELVAFWQAPPIKKEEEK